MTEITVAVGILTTMQEQPEGDARAATDPGLEITLLQHELDEFAPRERASPTFAARSPYSQLRSLIRQHPQLSNTAIKALNVVTGTGTINVHRRALALLTLPRDLRDARHSGLFDAEWYLAHYPEAERSGMDPLRHFVLVGGRQGFDPGPRFSTSYYLYHNPDVAARQENALLHYVRQGITRGSRIAPSTVEAQWLERTISDRFPNLRPLRIYASATTEKRISMVTDSISSGSLFGGVGTALIFATLLARRMDRPLRVITRAEPPNSEQLPGRP